MLREEARRHVEAAVADDEGPWKLLAWLEETQPTLSLNGEQPYCQFVISPKVAKFRKHFGNRLKTA